MKKLLVALIVLALPAAAHDDGASMAPGYQTLSTGPGSGLDADFLDGIDSLGFGQVTTMSGAGVTCADSGDGNPGALSFNPTCAAPGAIVIAPLVSSDIHGCTITAAEGAAQKGCRVYAFLVSSSGGTVTLADVAGVADVDGSWTPAVGDNLVLLYEDLSNDQWQELGRNKSWNAANDGSGSGLDADTVDGVNETTWAYVDGSRAFTGVVTHQAGITFPGVNEDVAITLSGTTADSVLKAALTNNTTSGAQRILHAHNNAGTGTTETLLRLHNEDPDTAVTAAIEFVDDGGGFTNLFLDVNGTADISGAEMSLLDGHAAALVDVDDAVATAITGTGALNAGSITSGFGAIDNGADAITTTGTVGTAATTTFTGAGATWTAGTLYSGAIASDIRTDGNEDLHLDPGGTGDVNIVSGGLEIRNTAATYLNLGTAGSGTWSFGSVNADLRLPIVSGTGDVIIGDTVDLQNNISNSTANNGGDVYFNDNVRFAVGSQDFQGSTGLVNFGANNGGQVFIGDAAGLRISSGIITGTGTAAGINGRFSTAANATGEYAAVFGTDDTTTAQVSVAHGNDLDGTPVYLFEQLGTGEIGILKPASGATRFMTMCMGETTLAGTGQCTAATADRFIVGATNGGADGQIVISNFSDRSMTIEAGGPNNGQIDRAWIRANSWSTSANISMGIYSNANAAGETAVAIGTQDSGTATTLMAWCLDCELSAPTIVGTVDGAGNMQLDGVLTVDGGGTNAFTGAVTTTGLTTHNGGIAVATAKFYREASTTTALAANPDTTTVPTGSFMRITATGATAWTPDETSISDGTRVVACNVDAESDVITLTASAGKYLGACILGINDCVTMVYDSTSSVWRESSCDTNP